jgi:hypothetical protein
MALYSHDPPQPQDKPRLFASIHLPPKEDSSKQLGELVINYSRGFRGSLTPEVPECYAKIQCKPKNENVLLWSNGNGGGRSGGVKDK